MSDSLRWLSGNRVVLGRRAGRGRQPRAPQGQVYSDSGGFDEAGRPLTYARALGLLEDGTIEVAPLISHRYPSLEQVQDALFADYHDPGYIKGVVTLNNTRT